MVVSKIRVCVSCSDCKSDVFTLQRGIFRENESITTACKLSLKDKIFNLVTFRLKKKVISEKLAKCTQVGESLVLVPTWSLRHGLFHLERHSSSRSLLQLCGSSLLAVSLVSFPSFTTATISVVCQSAGCQIPTLTYPSLPSTWPHHLLWVHPCVLPHMPTILHLLAPE